MGSCHRTPTSQALFALFLLLDIFSFPLCYELYHSCAIVRCVLVVWERLSYANVYGTCRSTPSCPACLSTRRGCSSGCCPASSAATSTPTSSTPRSCWPSSCRWACRAVRQSLYGTASSHSLPAASPQVLVANWAAAAAASFQERPLMALLFGVGRLPSHGNHLPSLPAHLPPGLGVQPGPTGGCRRH